MNKLYNVYKMFKIRIFVSSVYYICTKSFKKYTKLCTHTYKKQASCSSLGM